MGWGDLRSQKVIEECAAGGAACIWIDDNVCGEGALAIK